MEIVDIILAFFQGVAALWPLYIIIIIWVTVKAFTRYQEHLEIASSGIYSIDRMSNQDFIAFMYGFFNEKGVEVTLIREKIGYYGADLIVAKDDVRVAVHLIISDKSINSQAVHDAYGAKSHYHCQNSLVIANREFSAKAKEFALAHGVLIWDRERLIEELRRLHSGKQSIGVDQLL